MKKKTVILIIIGILAIFISGCSHKLSSPKIELNVASFDLGDINPDDGIRTETFFVKNTGSSLLKIISVSTSCGCATAELEMLIISPGESTTLTVLFDPDFHEEPEGRFSRTVFLETNDPANPEAELKIWIDILEGQ